MIGTSNNGLQTTVLTANTTGVQVFFTGSAVSTTTPVNAQGLLGRITIGADTTANTITCYDGISTSGTVKYKVLTPTATPVIELFPNVQFLVGLFIVVSGGTTVNISLGWL